MSFMYYAKTSERIARVTAALDALAFDDEHLHIEVRLVETDSGREVGKWSDEIAADAWSYEETWGQENQQ